MNKFILELTNQLNSLDVKKLDMLKFLIFQNDTDILILGNGGSNAISAHMAEDYTKALGKKATAFTDGARLTCYANDYGYESAFAQFAKEFSTNKSLVILISSSGNSANILNCAEHCVATSTPFVILTGFNPENKLRNSYKDKALLEFWVNSTDYGVVECTHEIILHSVI
jgi:D-sedoheptulose 7-phosphate isomerase